MMHRFILGLVTLSASGLLVSCQSASKTTTTATPPADISAQTHPQAQPHYTYVIVPGAWAGAWEWKRVGQLLQADGHDVHRTTLTGLGERVHLANADIDLDTHITDVVNTLAFEGLEDVLLVGHSYGGMVITGVGDRAADRVAGLVFLDAANPVNGQSLIDVAGPMINMTRPLGAIVDGVELVLLPAPGAAAFYGITDPDDLAWTDARLTGHPWKCFEQPLRLEHEDDLWAIPQFHIVCTENLRTRDKELMAKARDEGRFWEIDTGHDLMITEPETVTAALLEIADRS
jgi:pimeloyl-ACP methyl ester carboxylesterase